jgi:PAT family beta-lactamase induction signal transducer AmpG
MPAPPRRASPWTFVPGLYVLQGMPYFAVDAASNTFLAAMGQAPSVVSHWSSDLTLPWTLKPLWSPLVDLFGTKRRWLLGASVAVLIGMAGVAWAASRPDWFEWTIAACVLLALASATYDVACDGFYILALEKRTQEAFVGVRNACYRLGRILVAGGVVSLAGALQAQPGASALARGMSRPEAWSWAFAAGALVYAAGLAAVAVFAPRPAEDTSVRAARAPTGQAGETPAGLASPAPSRAAAIRAMLREYVARPRFAAILAFILFYRFSESMLVKMISPFLLEPRAEGGLGLVETQVGFAYGTVGVVALLAGGIAGGWIISRAGFARCVWPMAIAMHVPNLLFAWAAGAQPGPEVATAVVAVEQLGYGFGFSAYMVFLLQLARTSRYATTHYAISTGLMGLSAWLAGRWSGDLVEALGFERFFWLASALGLVGLATLLFVPRLEPTPK